MSDLASEYRAACVRAAVFDVTDRGRLEVKGRDAATFLHNLCSNDIVRLPPGGSCEAFFLNVKARVIGYAVIGNVSILDQPSFWLDVDPGQAEKLLRHLDRYLISEQVELTDRSGQTAQFHVAGPQAADIIKQIAADSVSVRPREPLGLPGYDWIGPRGQADVIRARLVEAGAHLAGTATYQALRIEAGTPVYGIDLDETHLGPEVGRTKQAISYTKGCYLGQEPVVRIRDLGQVNRTLLGVKIAGDHAVSSGAKLFREEGEVGQVTSSVVSPRLGVIALAYVRRGSDAPGTAVEVETVGGRRTAVVSSLPFSGPAT